MRYMGVNVYATVLPSCRAVQTWKRNTFKKNERSSATKKCTEKKMKITYKRMRWQETINTTIWKCGMISAQRETEENNTDESTLCTTYVRSKKRNKKRQNFNKKLTMMTTAVERRIQMHEIVWKANVYIVYVRRLYALHSLNEWNDKKSPK